MKERKRIYFLISILVFISFIVSVTSIYTLYRTALEETKKHLIHSVHSHAHLIKSLHGFKNGQKKADKKKDISSSNLIRMISRHIQHEQSYKTMKTVIAVKKGNEIIFFLTKKSIMDFPAGFSIPVKSNLAKPMQLALSGESGTLIALDYRGTQILAAFELITELQLGIVTKLDLNEIQKPFIEAAIIVFGVTICLVFFGSLLFIRIIEPIIVELKGYKENLEKLVKKRTEEFNLTKAELEKEIFKQKKLQKEMYIQSQITDNMAQGVNLVKNNDGLIIYTNSIFDRMFGYAPEELIGKHVSILNSPTEESPKKKAEEIRKIILKEGYWNGDIKHIRKDKTLFWSHVSISSFEHPEYESEKISISIHTDITEQRQARNKLYESNEVLEKIFDTTHFSVVLLDKDFNYIRVNKAYATECGHEHDFFIKKNHFDLYPHKENEIIFQDVVKSGEPFTIFERPFNFPDHPEWGTTYWNWTLHPIKNKKGEVEKLFFILDNITERVNVTNILRKENKFNNLLLQSFPAFYVAMAPDKKIIMINKFFCHATGYEYDEIIGENFLKFIPETEHDNINKKFEELFKEDSTFSEETILETKNGDNIICSWNIKLFSGNRGERDLIFGFGLDITNQRKTEEELKKNQKRLQRAHQIAHLGIWEYNLTNQEEFFSNEIYRIFGYEPQDPSFDFNSFLYHFQDRDKEQLMKIIDLKEKDIFSDINFELKARTKKEKKIVLNTKLDLERDKNQNPVKILGIFQDITEKKMMELKILDAIENERNRISRDIHDGIGQKLTAISYMVGSFKINIEKQIFPNLEEIETVLTWIKGVTSDTQAISQGMFNIEKKGMNLISILEEITNNVEKTFKVHCSVVSQDSIDIFDSQILGHIYFIVNEAINNSIKHGKAKRIIVSVSSDNKNVNIQVEDNGQGAGDSFNIDTETSGMGLKTMRYRANLINADFSAQDNTEGGFLVKIAIK